MILVTGAMGTIGSELVPQLVEQGARVRAGIHHPGLVAAAPEVLCKTMDFLQPETLDQAIIGCRRMFLLTPFHPRQGEMARNLIEAARRCDVEYIVGISCMADPDSNIGSWHHAEEQAIAESGIPYDIVRANTYMQNLALYGAETIRSEGELQAPEGADKVSYVDVRDAASVAAALLLRDKPEGKTHVVTGSEALTNTGMAEILSDAIGKRVEYVDVSEEMYRDTLRDQALPDWLVEALVEMAGYHRRGLSSEVTDVVQTLTGKRPITFGEFARDYASAFLHDRPQHPPAHQRERRNGGTRAGRQKPVSRS